MGLLPFSPLSALGAIALTSLSYKLIYFVNLYFLSSSRISRYLAPTPEGDKPWALVTGSSDGIGLETARLLYTKGFNVLLHGRNPEKLAKVRNDILASSPDVKDREIQFVSASASDPDKSSNIVLEHVQTKLKGGRLRVLVNNVGGGGGRGRVFRPVADFEVAEVESIININAIFPALLTRKLLPVMRRPAGAPLTATPDRVQSLIINVGSLAGRRGMAYVSTYASCKSFNHAWSNGLFAEMALEKSPVEVLGVLIGEVETQTNVFAAHGEFGTLGPDEMARDIVDRVGCGVPLIAASWKHAVFDGTLNFLPEDLGNMVLRTSVLARKQVEDKLISKTK
jgi:17beta-estradiol 17-dehydrogenase / very-long-chain 3-oxoacyl-CoA reductase